MRAVFGLVLVGCGQGSVAPEEIACATEPIGREVGEIAEDVELSDCEGEAVSLRDLCGKTALIVNWYGWCPSCESHAALARELAAEHPELQSVIVLNEDPLADPADPALCELYSETYPSSAQVWIDPADALETYGTTDLAMVLGADGTLLFVRDTATDDAIRAAVEAALSE